MSVLDEMLESLGAMAEIPPIALSQEEVDALICGDGCGDPECYRCCSPLRPENLHRLANNLLTAAGLCRAHGLGFDEGMDNAGVGEGYPSSQPWTPGCRRPAP